MWQSLVGSLDRKDIEKVKTTTKPKTTTESWSYSKNSVIVFIERKEQHSPSLSFSDL